MNQLRGKWRFPQCEKNIPFIQSLSTHVPSEIVDVHRPPNFRSYSLSFPTFHSFPGNYCKVQQRETDCITQKTEG